MSASQMCSAWQLSSRVVVAAAFIVLMLISTVPQSNAAAEPLSIEWRRNFSGSANSVIQTADGGYAIAGYRYSDALLIKTDISGNMQWEKTYGTDFLGGSPKAVGVSQTQDSGYVLFSESGYLVKTDTEGNVQWSTALGMKGACASIQASDGNYLVIGNTVEGFTEVAWFLKVNELGDIIYAKRFTGGVFVRAVIETNNRGYALAGNLKNDFWFAKVDCNNNLDWERPYAYGGFADEHFVYSITKTSDGGYMLAGSGDWQTSGGMVPWLIKIDFVGHVQWNLPYEHIVDNGFGSVVQTDDEGYLLGLSASAVLLRTESYGSEQWTLSYVDFDVESYSSFVLIHTSDRGSAIVGNTGSTIMLTKISPEIDVTPPVISILSPKNKTYTSGDVSLKFTVNEPTSWITYSLDGQDTVTITGNITLPTLSGGAHTITIYAQDTAGNVGVSETVQFSSVEVFPVSWIFIGLTITAGVLVCVLVYYKRQNLLTLKKQGLKNCLKKHHLLAFANNRMVRTLTIIVLCLMFILIQLFFPFVYFSSFKNSNSGFEVGVTYVYEQDNVGQIYGEVLRIHELGIKVIRVNLMCNHLEPNSYLNSMTDVFFTAAQNLDMDVALIIQNREETEKIQYYLGRWGKCLSYIQVLNEPESASSWDVGALFTDDEASSNFERVYGIVEQHQLSAQLYTNFGAGFVVRSNLPIKFSENLDFVGLDVFMDSFLVLSPIFVQLLHKITNKYVVITEFGMSTSDDVAQSDYIISGLNLFKSMELKGCWLVYWNSEADYYGIRGRLAEQSVGEWIAQNA